MGAWEKEKFLPFHYSSTRKALALIQSLCWGSHTYVLGQTEHWAQCGDF